MVRRQSCEIWWGWGGSSSDAPTQGFSCAWSAWGIARGGEPPGLGEAASRPAFPPVGSCPPSFSRGAEPPRVTGSPPKEDGGADRWGGGWVSAVWLRVASPLPPPLLPASLGCEGPAWKPGALGLRFLGVNRAAGSFWPETHQRLSCYKCFGSPISRRKNRKTQQRRRKITSWCEKTPSEVPPPGSRGIFL